MTRELGQAEQRTQRDDAGTQPSRSASGQPGDDEQQGQRCGVWIATAGGAVSGDGQQRGLRAGEAAPDTSLAESDAAGTVRNDDESGLLDAEAGQ
jgi:hypothetical protein